MASVVSRISAASSDSAMEYFSKRLTFETDCWDVHHAMSNDRQDFVLLDVRGEESYQNGYVPNAINLPHWKINETTLEPYPSETLFVVYCAGPHCNGANKGALALAKLGRPVKEMMGGAIGWTDEGFELVREAESEVSDEGV